jgi:hypothetical protein
MDQMVGAGVDHGGQVVPFSFSRRPLPRAHLSLPRIKHLSSHRKWRDEACDFDDGGECGLALELGGNGGDDAGAKRFIGGSCLIFE